MGTVASKKRRGKSAHDGSDGSDGDNGEAAEAEDKPKRPRRSAAAATTTTTTTTEAAAGGKRKSPRVTAPPAIIEIDDDDMERAPATPQRVTRSRIKAAEDSNPVQIFAVTVASADDWSGLAVADGQRALRGSLLVKQVADGSLWNKQGVRINDRVESLGSTVDLDSKAAFDKLKFSLEVYPVDVGFSRGLTAASARRSTRASRSSDVVEVFAGSGAKSAEKPSPTPKFVPPIYAETRRARSTDAYQNAKNVFTATRVALGADGCKD